MGRTSGRSETAQLKPEAKGLDEEEEQVSSGGGGPERAKVSRIDRVIDALLSHLCAT